MSMTHVFPTYERFPFEPISGNGVVITDNNGQDYLDFTSGIGVCSLGYQNTKVQNAVQVQLTKLWHISNLYENHLQESVASLLVGDEDKMVFFANSGTEANEAALKLARKATGKTQVLSFHHSFHGRTYGSMSMTGNPGVQAGYAPLVPDISFADYNDDASLAAITDDLAAVILEVIQGEGGVIVGDQDWLHKVQDKCQATHTLLIIDEVQTGIGRTGYKFAYQGFGLDPDIVTSAKALANGLPVGAMIGKSKLGAAFGPGSHGSTFAGNPLTMAAAEAVLTQLTPSFLEQVQTKSAVIWDTLNKFDSLDAVKSVSGKGFMVGIHLAEAVPVNSVIQELQKKGLLTLSAVGNTLRLLPPLVMSEDDLSSGLQTIYETLSEK
ncbi:acetylornithine transaminase [Secundilactobacillus folii]|uniref:Acetylornithine transaminase n=1 Tax=Secundilactobacillus folii TaxID=2678357 RepID=A0A7X3C2F8_9LACO|nr:acetylornithine transaminase [Secundilactobacillus folii]MTV81762.1 acetylornithine transaminase [Secundilactobacillus folii]